MKRKILTLFLAVCAAMCLCFGLAACGKTHTHSYVSSVTTAATCTEDGVMTYTCSCGDSYTETIEATGHSYENGFCTVCGAKKVSENLGYSWDSDETYCIVSGIGTCTDTDIVIPSAYNGLPVTSIGDSAFFHCTSLASITIPDSVTSIGDGAFRECTSLTSITIPDSVTTIGNAAFLNCTSLTSITIPDSVTSIGVQAFLNCTALTSITIPDGMTSIGVQAFSNCAALTSITIPDGMTSIGDSAFEDCTALTSITIPDGVTSIGTYAFYNCSSLESVTIGNGVTSIGKYAFYTCTALTEINYNATECADLSENNYVFYKAGQSGDGIAVNIGANVKKLPAYLFCPKKGNSYSPKIVSVVFEEGSVCERIGQYAFYACTSLTSVNHKNRQRINLTKAAIQCEV